MLSNNLHFLSQVPPRVTKLASLCAIIMHPCGKVIVATTTGRSWLYVQYMGCMGVQ